MNLTANKAVLDFVAQIQSLTAPDRVVWVDGSERQLDELRAQAVDEGEIIKLDEKMHPGCYYHRSALNDVARVEARTFICTGRREEAGTNNNWMAPDEAYTMVKDIMRGGMRGRTMYVIPFSMGPIGSPFSKIGIELTDSIYVVLNMNIMTRIGSRVLDALGDSAEFVRGVHGKCELDEQKRYILQFPEDNAIWSCNSGYGGNVLLGKKCFALRIASHQGRNEGWLAEHMLILGVEYPDGQVKYIAGAFPSACGKTNLAMLIPPEYYAKKGYKVWCVGDDIAWIRIGADGRLWAVNPEAGFFGVVPGTNRKTNLNAMLSMSRDTIFTNVVYQPESGSVWWEGLDEAPTAGALDWTGAPWDLASGRKGAHPNSRFTAPAKGCPCISPHWEDPQGVPLSAIIFGGRRAKTAPLVYQARDWAHGVYVGSIMASETTAAAAGEVGVVRRDPMAMLPFCGYNMGDYFAHWLDIGQKTANPPKIFNVNWFRTNENGKFIWPGYGENFRVLEWILARCAGEVDAEQTAIGYVPKAEDIDLSELEYTIENGQKFDVDALRSILKIENEHWREDAKSIRAFYDRIGDRIPESLRNELAAMERATQ